MMLRNLMGGALAAAILSLPAQAGTLADAVANKQRTAEFVQRDQYRHPAETLAFMGIQPDMRVVELWPGKGWYTEILGPYLRDHGQLIVGNFNTELGESPSGLERYFAKAGLALRARLASEKAWLGDIQEVTFQPPEHLVLAKPGSVDRVLTFRNIHNWHKHGTLDGVLASVFEALRPGGIFGVVEHRAKAGTSAEQMARSGYMTEDFVIAAAEKAGFRLAGRAEINANPRDDTDHPNGVWTLPPTLNAPEADQDQYQAIGESDRMTLKFVKP
ncbi:methyltransferase [Gallaecimonas sp. GXIMD4217]|uniref:class I SAM-dependent methyltransferase n=1 Tax=Gallaecimonas sp. GXIMD4217 TaxID=3131927 RepID=UPI00311AF3CD